MRAAIVLSGWMWVVEGRAGGGKRDGSGVGVDGRRVAVVAESKCRGSGPSGAKVRVDDVSEPRSRMVGAHSIYVCAQIAAAQRVGQLRTFDDEWNYSRQCRARPPR